jgi:hypothetical protein
MKGTMTGNRALFKIKGTIVGAGQNCSVDDNFGIQTVDGLGEVEALELVVGAVTHKISGEKYFVNSDTLTKLGIVPKTSDWLTAPEFDVEIIDSVSGTTTEHYTGCKFESTSRKYGKHQIVGESFSIIARHKAI